MKKTLLTAIIALFACAISAQQPTAYECTANFDKKVSGNAAAIELPINAKDAQNVMLNLLKSSDLKGKASGKTLSYLKIAYPEFTTEFINFLISFEEKSKNKENPITKVNVFIQKGISTSFESSTSDPTLMNNVKNFLNTKYYQEVYKYNLSIKVADKNKEIAQTQKSIDKMKKENEKYTKNIASYEESIRKAKDNIVKANNDIEKNKRDIASQQQSLDKLVQELKTIK